MIPDTNPLGCQGCTKLLYVSKGFISARAPSIRYICLRERRLARDQAHLRDYQFNGDEQGNGLDDRLDGLVDE